MLGIIRIGMRFGCRLACGGGGYFLGVRGFGRDSRRGRRSYQVPACALAMVGVAASPRISKTGPSTALGVLLALELGDTLAVMFDGLGSQDAALFILEIAAKFMGQLAGSCNHQIQGLFGVAWAW